MSASASGPLSGIRVIDMTQYLAGPYCAMLLADLGADIVKVERYERGEDSRHIGEVVLEGDLPALFVGINRNKRSVSLDLKQERAKELFRELVRNADVLVENYRPGVLEGLGLGYEELKQINPDLVYAKISGYGVDGPYGDRGGFDLILQAESGLLSITGEEGGGPASIPLHLVDTGTGMYTALGIVSALLARERTGGGGQRVDTALLNTALGWAIGHITVYYASGVLPERRGTADKLGAPSQAFRAKDGWLVLAAFSNELFARVCRALDAPQLAEDARYASNGERLANRPALEADIEAILAQRTVAEWLERLAEAGVPSAPINTLPQAFEHPQVQHNGMIVDQDHPVAGPVKLPATPIKLSQTPATIRTPAPRVGEGGREALREWLGMEDADVDALRDDRVIYEADAAAAPSGATSEGADVGA